nr:hypothetical protein [Tanacetum cinerariifolium]
MDERGIVIKNKARLVAQGHTQEEGIDYDEVFASVARIEAIRLFLAYASFMGFTVYQMDVKSDFLYDTIDEEVAMIDQTLFIRRQRGDFILVQVYVDDIIFGSSNPQLCREFEALMHEKFQMSAMASRYCSTDVPESSGNSNPTATSTNPPADQLETLTVKTHIPTVSSPVPTACLNDSLEPSKAMQEELLQFKIQNVWTLVDCPKGVRPIRTKWVLKNKMDERGIVIKNKAKLVAQGHTQEEGIDYDEVFASVARIEAIRLFLAYALFMGFTVYQMDEGGIFLSQDKYIRDILKKFGYSDVRSSNTPMDKANPWGKDETRKDVNLHLYRSMIGSLMYLTASRPDIMFP